MFIAASLFACGIVSVFACGAAAAIAIYQRYLQTRGKAMAVFSAMDTSYPTFDTVTRFEVIDHRHMSKTQGRMMTVFGNIQPSVQDGGKTLKIFLVD